jgi:hypothetical protein
MRISTASFFRASLFGLTVGVSLPCGCQQMALAPAPPLAPAPSGYHATTAKTATAAPTLPATPQEARVQDVGNKLLAANPQIHLKPHFVVLHTDQRELGHVAEENHVVISEGLVNSCATEGQLAAVVSAELAKLVAERQEKAAASNRDQYREPPPDVPIGRDAMMFGDADQMRKAELAKLGYDRRRPKDVAPPDPSDLARSYLRRAGYAEAELQGVQSLLPGKG